MDTDPRLLKSSAAEIASAMHQNKRLMRLMYRSGFLGVPSESSAERPSGEARGASADGVGIWVRRFQEGREVLVRDVKRKSKWWFWANVGQFNLKKEGTRIAWIGESVARGFFYDPAFNPAKALERLLQPSLATGVEVIDLAMTDLSPNDLLKLAAECVSLEPDVAVIFAGNNWRQTLDPLTGANFDEVIRREGVPGLKKKLSAEFIQRADRLVNEIIDIFTAKKIPVVWVIPEFNLADWHDPPVEAPILKGEDNRAWSDLKTGAIQAIESGDFLQAEHYANQLMVLDQGTNAFGPSILRRIVEKKGDLESARRFSECARDAEGWDPFHSYSPRVLSSTQEIIRDVCKRRSCPVVDLPTLFAAHLDGALPGRALFLDYCHLSAEAIVLCVDWIASKILAELGSSQPGPPIIPSPSGSEGGPSKTILAEAAFLAAVHNAHYYQDAEIINYWCRKALENDPEITGCMRAFVEIQTRRVPMSFCEATSKLLDFGSSNIARYLLKKNLKRLDYKMSEAISACVSGLDDHFSSKLDELRKDEHGIQNGKTDLLDFYYLAGIPSPSEAAWTNRSFPGNRGTSASFCKAYSRETKFILVCGAAFPIQFEITCRIPHLKGKGVLSVTVGDYHYYVPGLTAEWQAFRFVIPAESFEQGLNEIRLDWPDSDIPYSTYRDQLADGLLAGNRVELHRVFGEIDWFTASRAEAAARLDR